MISAHKIWILITVFCISLTSQMEHSLNPYDLKKNPKDCKTWMVIGQTFCQSYSSKLIRFVTASLAGLRLPMCVWGNISLPNG